MRIPIEKLSLLIFVTIAQAADPDLRIPEVVAKKSAIEKPAPDYPLTARQLKIAGKVSIEAVIAEDGHVSDLRIVSGNPILTKSAAEALKKWKFHPFQTAEGKNSAAIATFSFEFDNK